MAWTVDPVSVLKAEPQPGARCRGGEVSAVLGLRAVGETDSAQATRMQIAGGRGVAKKASCAQVSPTCTSVRGRPAGAWGAGSSPVESRRAKAKAWEVVLTADEGTPVCSSEQNSGPSKVAPCSLSSPGKPRRRRGRAGRRGNFQTPSLSTAVPTLLSWVNGVESGQLTLFSRRDPS